MDVDVVYKTGTMVKDPLEMTQTERINWQQKCAADARAYLFSIGQPLVYRLANGQMVAEYADGTIETLPEPTIPGKAERGLAEPVPHRRTGRSDGPAVNV